MIDSQQAHMHVYDGSQNDGKAKRWSHLRIIRVVVPSGKSAGEEGKKIKIKRKKRCKMKAMSAKGRAHWLQWKWKPSSHEFSCAGGHMTHASGSSRCWQTKPQPGRKMSVSFNRIHLSVTLQGLDHAASCHSKFNNQFPKSEIHGGLGEQRGLMCRVEATSTIKIIHHYPERCVSNLNTDCWSLWLTPILAGSLEFNLS